METEYRDPHKRLMQVIRLIAVIGMAICVAVLIIWAITTVANAQDTQRPHTFWDITIYVEGFYRPSLDKMQHSLIEQGLIPEATTDRQMLGFWFPYQHSRMDVFYSKNELHKESSTITTVQVQWRPELECSPYAMQKKEAVLQEDGTIVELDGRRLFTDFLTSGAVHVCVTGNNFITTGTVLVPITSRVVTLDLTRNPDLIYGGKKQLKWMEDSVWAVKSGDTHGGTGIAGEDDGNDQISDVTDIVAVANADGFIGFHRCDLNGDGIVNEFDLHIALQNFPSVGAIPFVNYNMSIGGNMPMQVLVDGQPIRYRLLATDFKEIDELDGKAIEFSIMFQNLTNANMPLRALQMVLKPDINLNVTNFSMKFHTTGIVQEDFLVNGNMGMLQVYEANHIVAAEQTYKVATIKMPIIQTNVNIPKPVEWIDEGEAALFTKVGVQKGSETVYIQTASAHEVK